MLDFYKKAAAAFSFLVLLNLIYAYFCRDLLIYRDPLLPLPDSIWPWNFEAHTDTKSGGTSSITVEDATYSLDYSYYLTEDILFPYVIPIMAFGNLKTGEGLVNLEKYQSISFQIKCKPQNVQALHLHVVDELATTPGDFPSYRIATRVFSCNNEWTTKKIDLKHLDVPNWWLTNYNLLVSDKAYDLSKVIALSFDASRQGPVKETAKIKIKSIYLNGRSSSFMWVLAGGSVLIWIAFSGWLFRFYTAKLEQKVRTTIQKSRPLIAYQQLSIEPHRDKEKNKILSFLASNYTNPEMNLEFMIAETGINRKKINDALREEMGLGFKPYLNKLRLTEAARLLYKHNSSSIADIARTVGYNNASYFNTLFKKEYGYTPKKVKSVSKL